MKHLNHLNLLLHLLWVMLLPACDKAPGALADLQVKVVRNEAGTRVEGHGALYEDDVLSVQLFAFDSRGLLEAEDYFHDCTGSLKVADGDKTVYALVNEARIAAPASESSLLGTVSELVDNISDRLVMVGSTAAQVIGDVSIVIRVKRLVSKIQLGEIAVDFAYGGFTGIHINSLYLTNVNSSTTLDGTGMAVPEEWFNRMGHARSACDGILFEDIGCTLPDKGSHKVTHSFYAYPNHTVEDTHGGGSFSARYTRLVIDTDLGYYHIDFPDLSPNKAYIINKVTITGPGAGTPEEHVERANCTFKITVKDWETGTSITEII